jgi:hypothetical protein
VFGADGSVAFEDGVVVGLLTVTVRPWDVRFSGL